MVLAWWRKRRHVAWVESTVINRVVIMRIGRRRIPGIERIGVRVVAALVVYSVIPAYLVELSATDTDI
jgi:hypothetical protein